MKKQTFLLMILPLLLIGAAVQSVSGQAERNDSSIRKKATYVAAIARDDLSLSEDETKFLEAAFYDRYLAGEERTRGIDDPAKVAEIKHAIHKEFSKTVYKHYGREKSAEIIAWYYNYTNKKR